MMKKFYLVNELNQMSREGIRTYQNKNSLNSLDTVTTTQSSTRKNLMQQGQDLKISKLSMI